jgi:hypothetical protein
MYFTYRPMYIYDEITLNYFYNKKIDRQFSRSDLYAYFLFSNIFQKLFHVIRHCWKFFGTSQIGDCIIHLMRRVALSRVQLNLKTQTEARYSLTPYLPRNNDSNCPQCYVMHTFTNFCLYLFICAWYIRKLNNT